MMGGLHKYMLTMSPVTRITMLMMTLSSDMRINTLVLDRLGVFVHRTYISKHVRCTSAQSTEGRIGVYAR